MGAGRSAQERAPGTSLPSPGVRRTFHHPVGSGVPVEARPGFGSKDILLLSDPSLHRTSQVNCLVVCNQVIFFRIKPLISCNAPSDLKSRPFSAFGAAVQSG